MHLCWRDIGAGSEGARSGTERDGEDGEERVGSRTGWRSPVSTEAKTETNWINRVVRF